MTPVISTPGAGVQNPTQATALNRRAFLASAGAAAVVAGLPAGAGGPVGPTLVDRAAITLTSLKDLSERALLILQRHFADSIPGNVFLAEDGENYHGLKIRCEHGKGSESHCSQCAHPLAGTPMIGAMSGYYEPEWDEDAAYSVLGSIVQWSVKPESMTDAEWAEALALVGTTPSAHAERLAAFEQEMSSPLPTPAE